MEELKQYSDFFDRQDEVIPFNLINLKAKKKFLQREKTIDETNSPTFRTSTKGYQKEISEFENNKKKPTLDIFNRDKLLKYIDQEGPSLLQRASDNK
jgi:hypothetical protein